MLLINGEPIEIRDSCKKISIRYLQGMLTYDCWVYDTSWNMVYQILQDSAYLSYLNFEETGYRIELNDY